MSAEKGPLDVYPVYDPMVACRSLDGEAVIVSWQVPTEAIVHLLPFGAWAKEVHITAEYVEELR